jgi:hypothetical protein
MHLNNILPHHYLARCAEEESHNPDAPASSRHAQHLREGEARSRKEIWPIGINVVLNL